MAHKRLVQRGKKMRGTRAYAIAKYFAHYPAYLENDLSLHPVLTRFYAGEYTRSDLDILGRCVRVMQEDELSVARFKEGIETTATDFFKNK